MLTTAALLVVLPDRSAGPGTRAPAGGVPWRERLAQLARYRDFGFVWAGRFLLLTGYYIFFNFQLYTLTDHLGVTVAVATSVVALNSTLSAVLKLVVPRWPAGCPTGSAGAGCWWAARRRCSRCRCC
ncbi:hypothetical protein [Pseudonocardia sp. ICBG601]|uniref:hypothetical protein n=1 Tax=Pseudonocardia sp. ICBG601 TaxID=2846759 RepID=UPI001CF6BBF9|nr:hypothetical protein [Pseudonocardia sp. ICBG601]